MQNEKFVHLSISLANRDEITWVEQDSFWKTALEAEQFFRQPIYAVILTVPSGQSNPKFIFACAVTPEADVLETTKAFLKETESAALFNGAVGIDIHVADSVPNRDEILDWLDANGAQMIQ